MTATNTAPSERTRPLVFIIGAGASKDFGNSMPLGSELAARIEMTLNDEALDTSPPSTGPISQALRQSEFGLSSDAVQAANQIRRSIFAQESIDDLLNEWRDRPDMLRVGKIAIAYEILKAERESVLGNAVDKNPEEAFRTVASLRDHWLTYLLKNLQPGANRRNIAEIFKNVGFLVFNYDRCIEQYLYWAFQSVGGLNAGNAAIALKKIPIVHVYGDLGELPFFNGTPYDVPFGSEILLSERVASRIKTYTEEDHDIANLKAVHDLILNAQCLVFLGFGYHARNLELLFSKGVPANCRVWGTSLNPDQTRLQAVQKLFSATHQQSQVRLESFPCAAFLRMYRQQIIDYELA